MTSPWQRAAQGANLLADYGSLGVTIFEEINSLAVRTGALNLGQGFPDQDGPTEIKELARSAIELGANQYAPGKGILDLRNAIAEHQQRFYGLTLDSESEVLVTTGATEAIAASLLALVSPGDEVLTLEPFYDSYGAMIALAGGKHVTVPLIAPDFELDEQALRTAFSDLTKIVLLNSPHNPSGAVLPRAALELIVELAHKFDAIIIADEVYEHLTYDVAHIPISTLPGAAERTITISSGGKTFSFTGWKIGWATGPAQLIAAVRTVKQFLSYSSGTPFQAAIAWGLRQPQSYFTELAADLAAKRDLLAAGLQAAGLTVHLPNGGYFINADVAPLGFTDAVALSRELPELIGVAAIQVAVFCHPDGAERNKSLLRFAFCKQLSVLEAASARLLTLKDKL
ncbi:aspartate aminotransferase [Renibacterium salmoninarum ATCC 33209]|uniref:Aspartate aminotransferase n=1 Tax=Renibacterium salmoninarum (strain ATCC 33209 / DSM 20767 / JCM 11484 / NBRC 15589 / NCIMB 2235) TaxID=288705 RepID=A9WMZ4_RENSM|nr:aminotransferase class I/II-fold pyridoxal phosphate-dependent enzyme [Renibacterium salmoninarum]ABY23514.1 aspartate aminotransferase [Renibacterium salmoninarum ATCC 33209]